MGSKPRSQSQDFILTELTSKANSFQSLPEYSNISYTNSRNQQYSNKIKTHLSPGTDGINAKVRTSQVVNNYNTGSSKLHRDKELPYLHHKHKPSVHWNPNTSPLGGSIVTLDDDGSTTTSGSYTVDDSGNEYAYTVV